MNTNCMNQTMVKIECQEINVDLHFRIKTALLLIYKKTFEPRREKKNCLFEYADQPRNCIISDYIFALQKIQFLYFLNPKFKHLSIFCFCTALFVSDLNGNPQCSFSRDAAHFKVIYSADNCQSLAFSHIYEQDKFHAQQRCT